MKIDTNKEALQWSKECTRCGFLNNVLSHAKDPLDYIGYPCNMCNNFDTNIIVTKYPDFKEENKINNKLD